MAPATVLAVVASAIFLVRLLPQPVRLWRTRRADGVSPLAAANAVTCAVGWTAYGLERDLPVVWAVSVLALGPALWAVTLLRQGFDRRATTGAVAIALAFVGAAWLGALGAVLSVGVLITAGPQVWRAVASDQLDGIAAATWGVALADASAWGLYGALVGDRALVAYGLVLFGSAVVVLSRVAVTRRAPAPVVAATEA